MRSTLLFVLAAALAACSETHMHSRDAGSDLAVDDLGGSDADGGDVDATMDAHVDAPPIDLGDASFFDAPIDFGTDLALPPDLGPGFDIHVDTATLWTCNCHHGCGPGIDGSISLLTTNTGTTTRTIQILDVTLTPTGGGTPIVTSASGYFTVMGTGVDHTFMVAGGVMEYRNVVPYIDLSRTMSGSYRIDIAARVDGVPITITLDSTFIPTMPTTGCP